MLKETLKDTSEILQHILSQPLVLENPAESSSLLSASEKFLQQPKESSELEQILQAFIQYPRPTEHLLIELSTLVHDLRSELKK